MIARLTDLEGFPVYVNPKNVFAIKTNKDVLDEGVTEIIGLSSETVFVQENIEDAVKALQKANL